MNASRTPPVIQVIQADPLSTALTMVPLLLWLLLGAGYILPAVLNGQLIVVDAWQLWMLILATLFCWLGTAWRVLTVQNILANGPVLDARIVGIWFFTGRGRVTYHYFYEGDEYTTSVSLIRNEVTERLAVGNHVALVIDPQNPKRVFLRDAFIKT